LRQSSILQTLANQILRKVGGLYPLRS